MPKIVSQLLFLLGFIGSLLIMGEFVRFVWPPLKAADFAATVGAACVALFLKGVPERKIIRGLFIGFMVCLNCFLLFTIVLGTIGMKFSETMDIELQHHIQVNEHPELYPELYHPEK